MSFVKYSNCDILVNWSKSKEGYPSTKSQEEMIELAIQTGRPIITKNGKNGRWYLKGEGKTDAFLQGKLNENRGKYRDGVFCLFLKLDR